MNDGSCIYHISQFLQHCLPCIVMSDLAALLSSDDEDLSALVRDSPDKYDLSELVCCDSSDHEELSDLDDLSGLLADPLENLPSIPSVASKWANKSDILDIRCGSNHLELSDEGGAGTE